MDKIVKQNTARAALTDRTSPLVPPRMRARWSDETDVGRQSLAPDHVGTLRRTFVAGTTILVSAALIATFYQVLSLGGLTVLEGLLLALFAVNIIWVVLGCLNAVIGFAVLQFRWQTGPVEIADVSPPSSTVRKDAGRTALLMATYNENPERVFGAAMSMLEALIARNATDAFDMFIISDTTDPDIWIQEQAALLRARQQLGGQARLYYRRRPKNTGRKTGNMWDWLERWGRKYDYMLVLDADSLMTGECMVRLAATMDANPQLGLLQTIPTSVGRSSIFARMQQFGSRLYGPIFAAGLAWWHRDASNFWGHNAIIRTRAFMQSATLPELPGPPPLGGQILSHDFVEAAFIRRAGWQVVLGHELRGSYEESPPSLLDFAMRDRRWCQGNLQHARLLREPGLHMASRFHFLTGVMSYVGGLTWLTFLAVGLALFAQSFATNPDYFPNAHALFPTWPRQDAERAISLFLVTMTILMVPKLLSFVWGIADRRRRRGFGGAARLARSILSETLVSTLIAPIQMMFQSRAIFEVLSGADSGWATQTRDDGGIGWKQAWQAHSVHTMMGIGLTGVLLMTSPVMWLWMAPICLGLMLSAPLSKWLSDYALGVKAMGVGLFQIPEEQRIPAVVRRAQINTQTLDLARAGRDGVQLLAASVELRDAHETLHRTFGEQPRSDGASFDNVGALIDAKLSYASTPQQLAELLTREERLRLFSSMPRVRRLAGLTTREKKRRSKRAKRRAA